MAKTVKEVNFIPLPVFRSRSFVTDVKNIYLYGMETFGEEMAEIFHNKLDSSVSGLRYHYQQHPECRHLRTKSRMYRNIVLGKYLIIYRITQNRIEVLKALHGSRSASKIRRARSIHI
jgi:toxin ParE1/3/4